MIRFDFIALTSQIDCTRVFIRTRDEDCCHVFISQEKNPVVGILVTAINQDRINNSTIAKEVKRMNQRDAYQ